MAGGIDWFRWHHGTVTDQKFTVIAKRAACSVAEVIAVWACLLEKASAAEQRGMAGPPDFEALDCALGMSDGTARAIFDAMEVRGLTSAVGQIVAWERRQPKRERTDDTSTSRVQAHRAMKRHETPTVAIEPTETPREEKRREELDTEASASAVAAKAPRPSRKCPESFEPVDAPAWTATHAPGVDWQRETEKFRDHTFKTAHNDWAGAWRNWMRRAAESSAGANRPTETAYARQMREKYERVAPMVAASKPGAPKRLNPMEILDGLTRIAG